MTDRQYLPVDPYIPPSTQSDKGDAFYAGFSNSTSLEPLDAIETINTEIELEGYSTTLENAKRTWELEQDSLNKELINALINDSEVPKEKKKQILENYISTKTIPLSLKEKYIYQINDEYLAAQTLENNDAAVLDSKLKIENLKLEQDKELIDEKLENKDSLNTSPQEIINNNINFIPIQSLLDREPLYDIVKKVIFSPLALVDGIIGLIPWGFDTIKAYGNIDYYIANQAYSEVYSELNEADQKELRRRSLNFITSNNSRHIPEYLQIETTKRAEVIKQRLKNKYGDKVDTVTAMYEYLQEEFAKDPTKMSLWLGKQTELKESLGIADDIEESYLAQMFKWMFSKINKAGEFITPDDPKKSALFMELFAAFYGPKVIRSTYRNIQGKTYSSLRSYADKKVVEREAAQKKMDESAIEKPREIKDVEGETIINESTSTKGPPAPPKEGPDINIKMNSPIATSTAIDPKVGNSIFATYINNPEIGPDVGLNLQSFLHQSLDGNGTLIGTNQIGSQLDVRAIPEVVIAAERQREIQQLDSNDIYYDERIEYIAGINNVINSINNIKVDFPIVVSPTFSTNVPLPEASGWLSSTVIRKSSTENYPTRQDATRAYNLVEKIILANREVSEGEIATLEPGELVIEKVVNAGTDAWNLIESFSPKEVITPQANSIEIIDGPTGKTIKNRYVKALVKRDPKTGEPTKLLIDKKALAKDFINKPWTKPKVKGVLALPENQFKTPQEWIDFVERHEIAHVENPNVNNLSKAEYENEINNIALKQIKDGNTYIVRWTKEMNQTQLVLEDFYDAYGEVPSKRTNRFDAAIQNILSIKVPGGAAGNIGQVSNIFTPYGQFTETFEKVEGGYSERIGFHRGILKDKVIERVLLALSAKQQKMLEVLVHHTQHNRVDTLSEGEIRVVLNNQKPQFGTPRNKTIEKLKRGLDSLRMLANQDFVTANLIRNEFLRKAGYDKAFYITDPVTKKITVTPVMENVILHRNDALYSEGGRPLFNEDGTAATFQAYSITLDGPIEFTPNVRDFIQKEGVFIYVDGMRHQQVYRVSEPFIGPDGHSYDYITFKGVKPTTLPTITLDRIPGYYSVIQKNSRFAVKYPLSHIHNGREVGIFTDPQSGEIIKLSELDYGNEFYGELTLEQTRNRNILEEIMHRHSKTIAGRETRNQLEEWHLTNPDIGMKRSINEKTGEVTIIPGEHIMIFKQAADLSTREIKDYYETINKETSTSKYRNEYLDSTIVEDPFRSLIKTSNQINANFATQQFLKQAEDIFVKLYVDPGPKSKVKIVSNNEHASTTQAKRNTLDTINDNFPFERGQIRQKGENVEDYNQALRMYDKIRLARYGQGVTTTANIIRRSLNVVGETLESNMVRKVANRRMLDGLVINLRKGQRYADVAVKVPSALAMSLMILMKPFRQFFIQMPVFIAGLAVSSRYNPILIARNLKDKMHLTATQGLDHFWRENPAYKEMQSYIWESDRAYPGKELKGESYPDKTYQKVYDIKFTNKDIQFIDQMRNEIMGKLSQHEWLGTVFAKDITTLGNPRNSNKIIDILNPKSWISNVQQFLATGFKGGEGIGRNGYIIVALRNWMYKNPEKMHRWKEQKHVNEWMQDALKGVGWMTGSRRLLVQRYMPVEFFTKFESFGAKQSLVLWNENSTGFKGKRRWEFIATGLVLLGTTPYAFHELGPDRSYIKEKLIQMMEMMGFEEAAKEFDKKYLHLNVVDILGNMWANSGDDNAPGSGLTDEEKDEAILKFGESLNIYGIPDYPFYLISRIAEVIGGLFGGEINPNIGGAGIANIKNLFGQNRGFNLMLDYWTPNKPFTLEERLSGTASIINQILPFLTPFDKLQAEKYLGDRYTKTGQPIGVGSNESEAFIVNLLGVQDYATQFVFDSKKYNAKKREIYLKSAQNFLILLHNIEKRKPGYKGSPSWNSVNDLLDKWTIELESRDFISGTDEHWEFRSQVRRLMVKQENSLMSELFTAFVENPNPTAKYYSEEDIKKVQELYEHYSNKYPAERDKILYRYNFMKERNKQWELIKQQKEGNK